MNIYDIAKIANVSTATVSRVVNNNPKVSEKTRVKIEKVISEVGYSPNIYARGLGNGSVRTIGIMCPNIADTFSAKAIEILEKSFSEIDYHTVLCCSGFEQKDKEKKLEFLFRRKVDAIILVGSCYSETEENIRATAYIKKIAEKVPVFLINGNIEHRNIFSTYADDYQGSYDAVTGLIESGKTRILFLNNYVTSSSKQKMLGYEKALKDKGLPIIGELKYVLNDGIYNVRDILLAHKNLEFDGCFCCNDRLAVGVLKYANAKGISVPDELSIVGYNNSHMSICTTPELTSVNNNVIELANVTSEKVIAYLTGKTVKNGEMIKCTIEKRCTTLF